MSTPIIVRHGLETDRANFTPAIGEWIFATDSKRSYMGDGVTPGGLNVVKKHFDVETFDDIASIGFSRDGDTCDVTATNKVYIRVNGTWINIYTPVEPVTWNQPTLNAGWTNYGNDTSPVRYTKRDNVVYLEGSCSRTNEEDVIFTLPVGYRPEYDITNVVFGFSGVMRMDIHNTGEVTLITNGTVDWVSFNISYIVGG